MYQQPHGASQALVPFSGDQYVARRQFFRFIGAAFHVYGPDGGLRFYVNQKGFKLKEDITVYADESRTHTLLVIRARGIIDFGATYDVYNPDGSWVGALRRKGMASILRDRWEILGPQDVSYGAIEEDSMALALFRRLFFKLVPQAYTLSFNGAVVGSFKQRFNPFIPKMDIDFSPDAHRQLDRRLGIAALVLIMAIEGRQN